MSIYLGLGANQGDRRANLEAGISRLVRAGFRLEAVSPVVESPAMLPPGANPAWNRPYLNLAVRGEFNGSPEACLAIIKDIETGLGRDAGERWSPRPIDIDILYWRGESIDTPVLRIPHAGACERDFVLTPLLHLDPSLPLGPNGESVFELTQSVRPIPLWMAIVNLTPDSFSDGDSWGREDELAGYLDKLLAENIPVIDIGAESTRPRGEALEPDEEWARLEPVLARVRDLLSDRIVRPLVSLDTRHPQTVQRALPYGIDIVNDVTGLEHKDMVALVRENRCQAIAMHSLSVPVDPACLLPADSDPVEQLLEWWQRKTDAWDAAGLDLDRIVFDPGIGFGKSNIQAFDILSRCAEMRATGRRLLVGHSRKSFMSGLTDRPAGQRDLETLGLSLALCQQGVDVIRVHSPFIHARAYRAWAHVGPCD